MTGVPDVPWDDEYPDNEFEVRDVDYNEGYADGYGAFPIDSGGSEDYMMGYRDGEGDAIRDEIDELEGEGEEFSVSSLTTAQITELLGELSKLDELSTKEKRLFAEQVLKRYGWEDWDEEY